MSPSQAAATPIVARNAGIKVVAISWDQSLNKLAKPMPTTVRLSQRTGLGETWFIESGSSMLPPKVERLIANRSVSPLTFAKRVSLVDAKAGRGVEAKRFFTR
jgi:hypothetical protein